jgi:glucose 1-dehydrogenase
MAACRACAAARAGHAFKFDVGELNRNMVLENDVMFGSVNANHRRYRAAAGALAQADKD